MRQFRHRRRSGSRALRITMLLENDLYPHDVRVRDEAVTLVAAGYSVHVISPRGPGQTSREWIDGVSVERYRLNMAHQGSMWDLLGEYAVAHLQLWLRGMRAVATGTDVIHAHNPPDSLFLPALIGRLAGCKFVFDQHDLFPDLFEEKFGRSRLLALATALQRLSVRAADLVLATNQTQAEIVRRMAKPGKEIRIVRNGPHAEVLAAAPPIRTGSLPDPHLVYVGALESQDGVSSLPPLLSRLVDRAPGTRMTIVGWGTELEPVKRRFAELGLAERVTFTGRVPHAEALAAIAQADICVDVAPCNEFNHRTTMVKISEYLALGRPTVSYALAETARVAGNAAVLVPCGEFDAYVAALERLCEDGPRRAQLSARARERARNGLWERSAEQLLDGYAALINDA